jgi:hypothetical protein
VRDALAARQRDERAIMYAKAISVNFSALLPPARAFERVPDKDGLPIVVRDVEKILNVDVSERVLQISLKRLEVSSRNTYIWSGTVLKVAPSMATFVVHNEILSADIQAGADVYQIRPLGESAHALLRIDPKRLDPDGPPVRVPSSGPRTLADPGGQCPLTPIRVLAVYSDVARIAAGGQGGIEAVLMKAESDTNRAYEISEVVQRVKLVLPSSSIRFDESGTLERDLAQIADRTKYPEVHKLRRDTRADVVSLIVNSGNYCGLAFLMNDLSSDFAHHAFSVVRRTCATAPAFSFAHELGHNMGSEHDRANARGPGVFPYSFGYRDPAGKFRDIMAYNCSPDCQRRGFSNPRVPYEGVPTGVDHRADPTRSADAARTFNETRCVVQNFRSTIN